MRASGPERAACPARSVWFSRSACDLHAISCVAEDGEELSPYAEDPETQVYQLPPHEEATLTNLKARAEAHIRGSNPHGPHLTNSPS